MSVFWNSKGLLLYLVFSKIWTIDDVLQFDSVMAQTDALDRCVGAKWVFNFFLKFKISKEPLFLRTFFLIALPKFAVRTLLAFSVFEIGLETENSSLGMMPLLYLVIFPAAKVWVMLPLSLDLSFSFSVGLDK
jgi:hypothetical protein